MPLRLEMRTPGFGGRVRGLAETLALEQGRRNTEVYQARRKRWDETGLDRCWLPWWRGSRPGWGD